MTKIEVTMEKTIRIAKEFDATDKQMELIENGDNPFYYDMVKEIETEEKKYLEKGNCAADIDFDYAIDNEDGMTIQPWGN